MNVFSFFGWPIPAIEGTFSLASLALSKRKVEISFTRHKILWTASLIIDGVVTTVVQGFGFDNAVKHLEDCVDDYSADLLEVIGPNSPIYDAVKGHTNIRPISIMPHAGNELEQVKRPSMAPHA